MTTIHICYIQGDDQLQSYLTAHTTAEAAKADLVAFCRSYWEANHADEEMPTDDDALITEVFEIDKDYTSYLLTECELDVPIKLD